ncbi:hypothetical protein HAX54_045836 [Datura stramonium]|uniref:Uncharacterized protein n=1 Tax=Datura stramonium TaxID=4076 RepID=A0ABS8WI26_DATST|nr:hypothetical protein [Datura stramonium]
MGKSRIGSQPPGESDVHRPGGSFDEMGRGSENPKLEALPFFATHYLRRKSEDGSQGPEARGLNTPMFQVTSLAGDAFTHLHASLQARNP